VSTFAGSNWKALWQSPEQRVVTERNMGRLKWLPRDIVKLISSFLSAPELLALGATCRGAASMTDDWLIWRSFFRHRFPRSALCPRGPNSSWRHAYMLEANGLAQDLVCFHSLSTKSEDVLGMPVTYTMNPKTGSLDYATSTFDTLSLQSFVRDGVRRTVWGERFTSFLPLYIDEAHFDRALGQLLKTARKIVGEGVANMPAPRHYGGSSSAHHKHSHHKDLTKQSPPPSAWLPRTDPEMALTLIMKMMNTQVVLVCDKGISASESALVGYCQLHRLLLGLVDKFHSLRVLVRKRLDTFMRFPESRIKEHTPSLGDLLTLLSVSDTVGWRHIGFLYLKESFDRSVLWACSKDPSLAKVDPGDETRLDRYLEVQKVSMRLTLFHAVFLNMLVQGGGSRRKLDDCADRYDTFQGRPPMYLRRQWQSAVNRILNFESWPEFFSLSEIALPTKSQLLSALKAAVGNSLKKGYHSHDTVFQNVMRSGVSKILLKGETYSAAPNLRRIRMSERWRFDGKTVFLDVSCLVYDFSRELIGIVDYTNTAWFGAEDGRRSGHHSPCIRHSGDVIGEGTGQHTIDIDIGRIPSAVSALFFTVSAWTTTLKTISQPSAHLHDLDSDSEMCRYKLEDQDTRDKTAVIMCKLHRASPKDRWALTSIGHVGYGRADAYAHIEIDISRQW
jgi:stress response protein SCP2